MSAPRHPSGETGAALLEILLGLALTAFLAVMLSQSARFGLGAVERAAASDAATRAMHLDLRAAREALAGLSGDAPALGAADRLIWRGAALSPDGWRTGARALGVRDGRAALLLCDRIAESAACAADRALTALPPPRFTYLDAEGRAFESWTAAAPPALIRVRFGAAGEIAASPRAPAAAR